MTDTTLTSSTCIKRTGPVLTRHISPTPGATGWNNSDVTVSFDCTDAGIGVASCPDPIVVTTDTKDLPSVVPPEMTVAAATPPGFSALPFAARPLPRRARLRRDD